ncbi:hypothetical protein [Rudaea sp.]|uniref:SLOG domain-containing protein n=1 Tax=Rudaea sp. TaxID=2136325 RepID=UPI003783271B
MLTVFLSASVPLPERAERFRREPRAAFEIEQAVISLARAVFARGGRLVFGGHPTISPLVAMVAGEYRKPRRAESDLERAPPSVVIYQSEAYREVAEEAILLIYELGAAKVFWTAAVDDERYDPEKRGTPQCLKSLAEMRRKMLLETRPDAMVCIGGMEGVLDEAALFEQLVQARMIYTLKAAGGAAAELASSPSDRVKVVEAEVLADVAQRRASAGPLEGEDRDVFKRRDEDEMPVTPYPLIFQTLVAELLDGHGHGGREAS